MNALSLRNETLPAKLSDMPARGSALRHAIDIVERDRRRTTRNGWLWIAFVLVLLLVAGSLVQIGGAIALSGQVRAGGEPVAVRPELGGRLAAVLVSAGDRVERGQPLLRLDRREDEALGRDLADRTDRLQARLARLQALIDEGPMSGDLASPAIAAERRLLVAERLAETEENALVDARRRGVEAQLVQLAARIEAQDRELAVTRDELVGLRSLLERGLTAQARVRGLERLVESLRAGIAASESERAALTSSLAEIGQDRSARRAARRAEWLEEWQAVTAELEERQAERERLDLAARRAVIEAPLAGIVINQQIRTPGSVIASGETLLEIVASEVPPLVQAMVPAREIEQIEVGQKVNIDLSPLDPVGGDVLKGTIVRLAADAVRDERGQSGFAIEIMPDSPEISLPIGAPVRVLIPTAQQSLLAQLLAPLRQRLVAALANR